LVNSSIIAATVEHVFALAELPCRSACALGAVRKFVTADVGTLRAH
jgi:hypothetical protein